MKRRILSSLMALVLVFGLLPVSAMAASVDATIVRTSLGCFREGNTQKFKLFA